MTPIYLDHNATTPLHPELKSRVASWMEDWGNPSSIHSFGRGPKNLLRTARKNVATALGIHPLQIVFTSGGSEANNLAIKGFCQGLSKHPSLSQRKKVMMSSVEHPSVLQLKPWLEHQGFEVLIIPVNSEGQIDLEFYQDNLDENVALVSVMWANNETGHIFPVNKMAKKAHKVGALFHSDMVQALGKTPLSLNEVDFASFSSHKFYSLKGTGILYIKEGQGMEALILGGSQERARRAGTENILSISSMGEVMTKLQDLEQQSSKMKKLRDHMQACIEKKIPDVHITGITQPRLPNTLHLVISGVSGESLLMGLDLKGFAVSTGAACSSGSPQPSPVLLAMGFSEARANSSLRISLGWFSTLEEINFFVDTLKQVTEHLREVNQ